ncbi:MAG: aldose 1-epimerase [Colwellia sp.]|jgi:aldose 1-epimerase
MIIDLFLDNSPFEPAKVTLTSVDKQISLSVYTDPAAIQLYTGFYLSRNFSAYQGLCLVAQNFTNANNKNFTIHALKPKQEYKQNIILNFQR